MTTNTLDELIKQIQTGTDKERIQALRILLNSRHKRKKKTEQPGEKHQTLFIRGLEDNNETIRSLSAYILRDYYADTVFADLFLQSQHSRIREIGYNWKMPSKSTEWLLETFKNHSNDEALRSCVAYRLKYREHPEIIDSLISGLADEAAIVRSACIDALVAFKNEVVLNALISMLCDENAGVRRHATMALSEFGEVENSNLVSEIIALLDDVSSEVREYAVLCLGYLRDKQAIRPVRKMLDDPVFEVRDAARIVLRNFRLPKDEDGRIIFPEDTP